MPNTTISLVFHNHQPVGNFGDVFARGYDECYRPLLDLLAEFPAVRVGLHHTGPLLEWLDAERPAYLRDLAALCARDQIEPLGGGFYEPMLAVLPARDAAGQLAMMNDFCRDRLGRAPRGMWLAERVWEPALAERIAAAGLKYTLLDDTHFRAAGMTGPLGGHFVTEAAGAPLSLFPIDKALRYAIPFAPAHEAVATIRKLGDAARAAGLPATLTYGDDGEKFGMWPGTHDWVWGKGWLREFFKRLSDPGEGVTCAPPGDVQREVPPSGRIYVPTCSYYEMGEWTLPAEAQLGLHDAQHTLTERAPELAEKLSPFVRGGIWQSFMARYPEADTMHKKMVWASRAVDAAAKAAPDDARLAKARAALYRGQCNCAYWHGLFGGLYLNYLRHAVYANLIEAEQLANEITGQHGARTRVTDWDADLRDEVILENDALWLAVDPDQGGAIVELDARGPRFNLLNVLSRHAEGYHRKVRDALAKGAGHDHGKGDAPKSIHDLAVVKDPNLGELLTVDDHRRAAFVERFLPAGATPIDLERGTARDAGDFAGRAFKLDAADGGTVRLSRDGHVAGRRVRVDKTISLDGTRVRCVWTLALPGDEREPLAVRFAPELCFTFLAGHDLSRRFHAPGLADRDAHLASSGALPDAAHVAVTDEWSNLKLDLAAEPRPVALWRAPLETASQSESGFERTYQGSALSPIWEGTLAPGATLQCTLTLEVAPRA